MENQLRDLQTPVEYRSNGRTGPFPSDQSLQWFIRRHRQTLMRGGALVCISRRIFIDPPRFDAVVLEVGRAVAIAA